MCFAGRKDLCTQSRYVLETDSVSTQDQLFISATGQQESNPSMQPEPEIEQWILANDYADRRGAGTQTAVTIKPNSALTCSTRHEVLGGVGPNASRDFLFVQKRMYF